jgi:hypothetical protein
LCKKCDTDLIGEKYDPMFGKDKDFYEESISEFLSTDEVITTLNLNETNRTVWLGTNLGNLISFSSITLEKKDLIKTVENSKIN